MSAHPSSYDLIVIGSGPGGEVGAIRAAQLGLKVALVEKREHLGGTCLNVGCIPTKAMLEAAKTYSKLQHLEELGFTAEGIGYSWEKIMARKEGIVNQQRKGLKFLMKKNKIDVFHGEAKMVTDQRVDVFETSPAGERTEKAEAVHQLQTKHTLLAMGSKVRTLPFLQPDHKVILSSDSTVNIDHVPKSLVVIGGGVVGLEFASLFGRFGTKVTVVEVFDQLLGFEDQETVKELLKHLKKQNITLMPSTKVSGVDVKGDGAVVHLEGKDSIETHRVLLSIGRQPVTAGLGLEGLGIKLERDFVVVDEHYRTARPNVYAIGDIINTPALAHTASAEAMHAVEVIAGHKPPVINYETNPSAIYSYPELASIGRSEEQLKKDNVTYKSAKFPFAPLAKAKIEGATEGFIKILFEPKYKEILGVHIIGGRATELIAEFSLGKNLETTVDEIGHTIHPHPTISETVMEAAHAAMGGAIHM